MQTLHKYVENVKEECVAFKRQLNIPIRKRIPHSLIKKILKSMVGKKIKNPTKIGKPEINITPLIEERAVMANSEDYL